MSQNPIADTADTRERILRSALRLFRQHGYHGVGIADVLALAGAPKGSLYHHFPGGKEAIGVAVVQRLTGDILRVYDALPDAKPAQAVAALGEMLVNTMEHTRHELCTVFTGFITERSRASALGDALQLAYAQLAQVLADRMVRHGWDLQRADHTAWLVVMVLEGGATVAQVQQSSAPFRAAAAHAVALCTQPLLKD